MASSQMEIPSISHGFGFILRDRNQNYVVSKKNLKESVKDHHHHHNHNQFLKSSENSENFVDSYVKTQNKKKNTKEKCEESKRNGASSLVQIWEARLNRSHSTASSSRSDSGVSVQDSNFSDGDSELADESETKNGDRTVEIESVSDSGRVADLIRRLSNEEKLTSGGEGLSMIRTTARPYISSSEKSSFPMVSFSPRLRGRQAFTDLLMQMERDRHRELDLLLERNAVSRFTQRGRLQSMLRLRNLKRCLAIQDRNRSNAKPTGLNRIKSGSAVMHLREKFRAAPVTAPAAKQSEDHHRSAETKNEAVEETCGSTSSDWMNMCKSKIEESKMNCLELHADTCNKEEKASLNVSEPRLQDNQNENVMESCIHEILETQTQGVGNESNETDQCLEQQEVSYWNGWEDHEEYEYEPSYYGETNNDWLNEISRPRSYWEELRKSRYLEVMNTRSEKEDIRRLLERRTVTDFLESGLREQIDKLIMSRVQTNSNKHSEKRDLPQEVEENGIEEEIIEEEPLTEGEEQDDRDDSSRSSSSHMFASSPAGSWSSQDSGDTSPHVLSVQHPNSPDMELLSCMRSEIQQLQQEMSLLRESVKTCLDANASLQQSVQRENPLKRKCCLCNETQVEAVLYRCGHLCTCLKCANELHWSGGKCPICRAQIMDVIRVYFDTQKLK